MSTRREVPAPLLVLGGVVSVQFGGALAATLIPDIGVGGSVLLRLGIATLVLLVAVRPRLRGHTRRAWVNVIAFGLVLGAMNWSFYGSLAHLPIGVAVTVEFIGPLLLAAVLSRRVLDLVAVVAAAVGVVLISDALRVPFAELPVTGLLLAAFAGACWAGYILLSGRVGGAFARLDGLAIAMVVATVLVVPVGVPSIGDWGWDDVAKGAGIAILSSVLPYSLELMALRRLSAKVFGVLLSLEPAVAALAGLLILSQVLGGLQIVGLVLVVAASVIVLGLGAREGRAPEDPEIAGA